MTATLRGRPGGYVSSDQRMPVAERVRRIWSYRRILGLLVGRDLKVRYAGSVLGYLWSVLDPLLMSLVYWFVFSVLLQRNVGYHPYIVFLVCGQLPWAWISGGVTAGTKALRTEAQMVRSTNVPRELWILRSVLSKGVEYLLSLPVIAAFALGYLLAPSVHIVLLPVAMLLTTVLLTGVGLLLAPLCVLARDVERVVPIVLRILFYVSPILYSVRVVEDRAGGALMAVNPLSGILMLYRATYFPQELRWGYVAVSAAECVAILAVGLYVFARLERAVLKEI